MSGAEVSDKKGKRKAEPEAESDVSGSEDEKEDLDQTTVDVDFEFFDPKPIDFHGLKSLLRQTFSNDTKQIDISGLADVIIEQSAVGTMVKVDDGTDPYAVLTVVGLNGEKDKDKACVANIRDYILEKCKKDSDVHVRLSTMFSPDSPAVALMINERLLNMPPQIVPPMFKMLVEELGWAVEDNEPYDFEYYIYVSKVYQEIESALNEDEGEEERPKKKKKKAKAAPTTSESTFYFQPEDEIIAQHADLSFDFKFEPTKDAQVSDSRRAFQDFGIDPSRRLFVIHKDKIKVLLEEFESTLQA
ncbi:Mss4p nuclear export [Rhizophlyctis rosea]|nr:Mss4p nuclear export [Rhizophlyctis rosea]